MNDIFVSLAALIVLSPLLILIWVLVRSTSRGPGIHWSRRVGRYDRIFLMPKFRTMTVSAPQLPADLMSAVEWTTPFGQFLRRTFLDELPQFWSVLKGDMSLVGPRPALFNQYELVELRRLYGVNNFRPGLTGWAQVNGRDHDTKVKVQLDAEYAAGCSFLLDLKIIARTLF